MGVSIKDRIQNAQESWPIPIKVQKYAEQRPRIIDEYLEFRQHTNTSLDLLLSAPEPGSEREEKLQLFAQLGIINATASGGFELISSGGHRIWPFLEQINKVETDWITGIGWYTFPDSIPELIAQSKEQPLAFIDHQGRLTNGGRIYTFNQDGFVIKSDWIVMMKNHSLAAKHDPE